MTISNDNATELLQVCKDALKLFGEEGVWTAPKWMQIHRGEMLDKMRGAIKNAEKSFYTQHNIGKAKYVVNFYDGEQTHKDGSKFYDMRIFKNKKKLAQFEEDLINQGYKYRLPS